MMQRLFTTQMQIGMVIKWIEETLQYTTSSSLINQILCCMRSHMDVVISREIKY